MMNELKRYVLTKDNRIIDFSIWTIRDTNSKVNRPLNHIERITHIRGIGSNDDTYQDYLNTIKMESDNVFDLIEVGDLVEESDFNEIYKVKIFDNGKGEFRDRLFDQYNGDLYVKYEGCDDSYYSYIETLGTINIVKIFKPNTNGDYIKVWEKESE